MFVASTETEAIDHLVEHWAEVPKGTVYPGLQDDSTDAMVTVGTMDVALVKVRYRAGERKFGAMVAIDEDSFHDAYMSMTRIVDQVAHAVDVPTDTLTEWQSTTLNPGMWNQVTPIPNLGELREQRQNRNS